MDEFLKTPSSKKAKLAELYDRVGESAAPFVFPRWVCGDFEISSPYGDTYAVEFRRAPRKQGYAGRFVLWWDCPDQGKVLLGVYDPATESVVRESKIPEHDAVWNAWETWVETESNGTRVNYACAWCGRDLPQESEVILTFLHDTCRNKIGKA